MLDVQALFNSSGLSAQPLGGSLPKFESSGVNNQDNLGLNPSFSELLGSYSGKNVSGVTEKTASEAKRENDNHQNVVETDKKEDEEPEVIEDYAQNASFTTEFEGFLVQMREATPQIIEYKPEDEIVIEVDLGQSLELGAGVRTTDAVAETELILSGGLSGETRPETVAAEMSAAETLAGENFGAESLGHAEKAKAGDGLLRDNQAEDAGKMMLRETAATDTARAGAENAPAQSESAEDTTTAAARGAGTADKTKTAAKKAGEEKVSDTGHAAQAAADRLRPESAKLAGEGRGEGERKDGKKDDGGRNRAKQVKVEVRDVRAGGENETVSSVSKESIRTVSTNSGGETEIIVNVKGAADSSPAADSFKDAQAAFKAGSSMENFLARELHQNLNGDIVRQADLQLRGGGEASIRLALKPEMLGNVKIRLEMSENKITGKIVVESKEALRAFEEEIHNLEEMFREQGYEGASIETSLASGGGSEGTAGGELRDSRALSGYGQNARFYGSEVEAASSERTYNLVYADKKVNVLV